MCSIRNEFFKIVLYVVRKVLLYVFLFLGICVIYGNFDSELPRPRDIKKGDNVTLRCKSNYLEGTTWSVCNEEGRMSTPEPKCKCKHTVTVVYASMTLILNYLG